MPIINTYYSSDAQKDICLKLVHNLKQEAATLLSCGDITLEPSEVSVRLIETHPKGLISRGVEIEIFAHAFKERVEKQDEICLKVREYLMKAAPELGDVRVWLMLAELGHSWE